MLVKKPEVYVHLWLEYIDSTEVRVVKTKGLKYVKNHVTVKYFYFFKVTIE